MGFNLQNLSFVLLLYLALSKSISPEKPNDSAEEALEFVNNAVRKVVLAQDEKIALFFGNTGCGKTTLIHYVACDFSKLLSIEPPNLNSIDFVIRDELDPDVNITTSSTVSRTLIPEKIVDNEQNVWYDLPGLGDTRNETAEIAATFLMKKVIKSASSVKIVLVVNYASVTDGNNRDDFDNLLSGALQLIKNVKRFENSVSLVVTKVPSFKMRGRQVIDIYDDSVKNTTVEFISAHRSVLHEKGANDRKIQLIDTLVKQSSDGDYPRISIFWRPNDVGPFNTIDKMVIGRQQIRESILNSTSFSDVQPNDFGFALTAKAKIKVAHFAQHTIDNVSMVLQSIIEKLLIGMRQQIKSTNDLKKRLELIERGRNTINSKNETEVIRLSELSDRLKRLIGEYNVPNMNEFTKIEKHEQNLKILCSLMQTDAPTDSIAPLSGLDSNPSVAYQPRSQNYASLVEQIVQNFTDFENEAQNDIKTQSRLLIENISTVLKKIDRRVLFALQKRLREIDGFQNRLELLQMGRDCLNSTKDEIVLKKRTDQFLSLIQTFDINSVDLHELHQIESDEKDLMALQTMSHWDVVAPVRDWIAMSSNVTEFLTSTHEWYAFLADTFKFLGSYEIQKNVSPYNVADLSNWGQLNKPQGLWVDENNFGDFTKRIARGADFESTPSRLVELNEIIDATLKSPTQIECNGQVMTIQGFFLKSSDIQLSKCSNGNDVTVLNVYVVDTFYVDGDLYLNKTKEVQLNIFATTWHILQESTFYLNGIDGKLHPPLTSNGKAGKPGNHGTNAGHFFGLTYEVINGNLLRVELNGGNGGNGQDGTGNPDVDVIFNGYNNKRVGVPIAHCKEAYLTDMQRLGYNAELLTSRIELKYRCCGSTGTGGVGGSGGINGVFTFIPTHYGNKFVNFENHPKSLATTGLSGTAGKTAKLCKTDAIEFDIYTDTDTMWLFGNCNFNRLTRNINRVDNPRCPNDYLSEEAVPAPKPRDFLDTLKSAFLAYKTFLIENMRIPTLLATVHKAYDAINSNEYINQLYTPKEFVIEANALEVQFYKLSKHIDVVPLYDELLLRIENITNSKVDEQTNVARNVLALLYSTLLSKTISLRSGHSSDLIIDIQEFLQIITRNINEFNEIQRIEVINKQRDDCNKRIMAKIQEANNFITTDIQPEIEMLFTALNDELEKTINETKALESKTIKEIQKKEANAIIIRRNAQMRRILGVIKSLSGFVSILVCGAFKINCKKAAKVAVGSGARTIAGHLIDPKIETIEFPLAIERLRNELRENGQEKLDQIECELKNLKKVSEGSDFSNGLDNLIAKVEEMQLNHRVEHQKISNMLNECMKFVNEWQLKLSTTSNETSAPNTRQLQRTANALAVISSSISRYHQFSEEIGFGVDEIGQAINGDRKALLALFGFENEIHAELMPIVGELHASMTPVQQNLSSKSSVALDVMQWNVRKALSSVQTKLTRAIAGFKTADDIKNCVVRVNEAISLVINIYDRIQNYDEQSKFVSFLSEMQSVDFQNIGVDDAQLRSNVRELHLNFKANLILAQYYRAIEAFKQAVFPFAADYLDIYDLPEAMSVDDLQQITTITAAKVRSLSEKIKEYNTTVINENDQHLQIADFNNEPGSKGPFYVWHNHEVRDKIAQLFDGRKIYLYADIARSDKRNAVKFSVVDLEFRTSNQSVNNQLEELLQSFHLSLTHMGESNYRCRNDFYSIFSRPLTIKFSLDGKKDSPTDRNSAYEKLKSSIQLLSPYTLWAVQLSHGDFETLKPFADLVNIELHGFGQYLREDATICETNLEKFYALKKNV